MGFADVGLAVGVGLGEGELEIDASGEASVGRVALAPDEAVARTQGQPDDQLFATVTRARLRVAAARWPASRCGRPLPEGTACAASRWRSCAPTAACVASRACRSLVCASRRRSSSPTGNGKCRTQDGSAKAATRATSATVRQVAARRRRLWTRRRRCSHRSACRSPASKRPPAGGISRSASSSRPTASSSGSSDMPFLLSEKRCHERLARGIQPGGNCAARDCKNRRCAAQVEAELQHYYHD